MFLVYAAAHDILAEPYQRFILGVQKYLRFNRKQLSLKRYYLK